MIGAKGELQIIPQQQKINFTRFKYAQNEDKNIEAYDLNIGGYILKPATSKFIQAMETLDNSGNFSQIPNFADCPRLLSSNP